mmetsp:Transcript_2878/g.3815  ORF Transcript_2878/g.3815 Transcript_2878/m.3815 type:complete len:294 (+) Transcript_2878:215-1096(+)
MTSKKLSFYSLLKLSPLFLVAIANGQEVEPRIINGEEVASPSEYPWFGDSSAFANIGEEYILCGFSLVAPDIILSAAHCEDAFKQFETFVHPTYEVKEGGYLSKDFIVVKIPPQEGIDPVPIDSKGLSWTYKEGKSLWTMGKGDTDPGPGEVYPAYSHHVEIKYVDQCKCYDALFGNIDESMMCAADPDQDACQGDSGGPLYDKENDVLVGIVSWGIDCAHEEYPGVYARIADQWPWIKETICSNTDYKMDYCDGHDANVTSPNKDCSSAPFSHGRDMISKVLIGISMLSFLL